MPLSWLSVILILIQVPLTTNGDVTIIFIIIIYYYYYYYIILFLLLLFIIIFLLIIIIIFYFINIIYYLLLLLLFLLLLLLLFIIYYYCVVCCGNRSTYPNKPTLPNPFFKRLLTLSTPSSYSTETCYCCGYCFWRLRSHTGQAPSRGQYHVCPTPGSPWSLRGSFTTLNTWLTPFANALKTGPRLHLPTGYRCP